MQTFKDKINILRKTFKMTQEEFAEKVGVTHQSVQKWESGETKPDLEKLIRISKIFNITIDSLLFDSDMREKEERSDKKISPAFDVLPQEFYADWLATEYKQCCDEGLNIAEYEQIFLSVSKLRGSETKNRLADVLFGVVLNAALAEGYTYVEPSDLAGICAEKKEYKLSSVREQGNLREKIAGAWYGRICGCMLGKPVECTGTDKLIPFLKETNNYPMRRYIRQSDVTEELVKKLDYTPLPGSFPDVISCAPADDDTNYTVLNQKLIEECGRDFTPFDVSRNWMNSQPRSAYCTAEKVAYSNFVNGYTPPDSAVYKNPFREWIGAQIRGDYFGYINPGDPEKAAEMAWRDACISHVKNGIYGEMFVAAALACAAVADDMEDILRGALAQIPCRSRFFEHVSKVMEEYRSGVSEKDCYRNIHTRWNEFNQHHWTHTIANAEIVTASLLYGGGDFQKSICLAVQTGFDTDCNGATVGSIFGMKNGLASIGEEWIAPTHGKLETAVIGKPCVEIKELVDTTMRHIAAREKKQKARS